MRKRRIHGLEFKATLAMEAISCRKTLQEIAADCAERLSQVGRWMKLGK
ncbi:hypothetical protein [Cyanobium sp. Lug-B]|jgi:putative transposase|nr:hypothetical protein [Cyanobium sp. Lug-B]